ncbi:MAG: hypothetical protein GY800_04350 [Planctomycetes bacterium]|nr:hypothetical protein [Planctomycetota bacterium]
MRFPLITMLRLFLLTVSVSIFLQSSYVDTLQAQEPTRTAAGRSAELEKAVRAVKESYYPVGGKEVAAGDLEGVSSLEELVGLLDKDSAVVDRSPSSLEFVRGLRPEDSVAKGKFFEEDEIGYIKIRFFGRRTLPDFKRRIGDLGDMSGLIIDLRDNHGGHLKGALDVLSNLVPSGKLLLTEVSMKGQKQHHCRIQALPTLTEDVPIVVLINNSTASSAEIMAATLRYYNDAVIVGETSHAKGTIQAVVPLSANKTLLLTSGEYILVDGSSLKDTGIVPDHLVKGEKEQLDAAISILTGR